MSRDFEPRPISLKQPAGYMENPFIGPDGKDYCSIEALEAARAEKFSRDYYYKSSILGKEYPVTHKGAEQMRRDEAVYWDGQKIDLDQNKILYKYYLLKTSAICLIKATATGAGIRL